MRSLTRQLQDRTDLAPADVERSVAALLSPEVPDAEKAAFLRALREKRGDGCGDRRFREIDARARGRPGNHRAGWPDHRRLRHRWRSTRGLQCFDRHDVHSRRSWRGSGQAWQSCDHLEMWRGRCSRRIGSEHRSGAGSGPALCHGAWRRLSFCAGLSSGLQGNRAGAQGPRGRGHSHHLQRARSAPQSRAPVLSVGRRVSSCAAAKIWRGPRPSSAAREHGRSMGKRNG